ncbi:hypothetical protein GFK18_23320, partial [Salmonella enterica subsp. enterica serovar Enteritidis]|nr:hypothetical protein [Salmonella enterica subsp. enterica serovar Enteritidis]
HLTGLFGSGIKRHTHFHCVVRKLHQIAAMGATIAGMGVESEIASTGIKNFMLSLTAGNSATPPSGPIRVTISEIFFAFAGPVFPR